MTSTMKKSNRTLSGLTTSYPYIYGIYIGIHIIYLLKVQNFVGEFLFNSLTKFSYPSALDVRISDMGSVIRTYICTRKAIYIAKENR